MKDRASAKELRVRQGTKRNEIDRNKDIAEEVALYAKGRSFTEIAEEISRKNDYSISREMARLDVESAMVEWKRENMENVELIIARECKRLDEIEELIRANFERSKVIRPNEMAALMKQGLSPDEIIEMYTEESGEKATAGDARYLQVLINLCNQRMKLLGLTKGNDVPSQNIVQYNFNGVGEDMLAKLADSLQDSKFSEYEEV